MFTTLSTLEQIYKNHTDYDIFKFYIPELRLSVNINSPLRNDDTNPSFRVYYNKSGNLNFCDYMMGITGNVFEFVKLKFGLTYQKALEKIKNDLQGKPSYGNAITMHIDSKVNEKTDIGYTIRKATNKDRLFWNDYFTIDTVKKLMIYPASNIFINGFKNEVIDTYVYLVGSRVKVYRPFEKPKYFGNTNKNSIQGWHLLDPNIKDLMLVSSLKEVGVLLEQGIQAIAPNSESSVIDAHIIRFLKTYWNLTILYDWDKAGILHAEKQSELYNIPVQPLQYEQISQKDISDFRKEYGFNLTKDLCRKLQFMEH